MMQQTGQTAELDGIGLAATGLAGAGLMEAGLVGASLPAAGLAGSRAAGTERMRVETVVETLTSLRGRGESLAEVAHDARNMVTALGLYCDLLEEPGVLTTPYLHYGGELRLVATASRRLVEKLVALDLRLVPVAGLSSLTASVATRGEHESPGAGRQEAARHWDMMPAVAIDNLAQELAANRNLLAALAGPAITLSVVAEGGALPVRLTGEDLTRILVNLVKNAAEAMQDGGTIRLGLRERPAAAGTSTDKPSCAGWKTGAPTDRSSSAGWKTGVAGSVTLTVEDNGPGIAGKALKSIFESGYTTKATGASGSGHSRETGWPASHRGLGLSITRSIVEAAGGSIHAANRDQAGARFEIELPVHSR